MEPLSILIFVPIASSRQKIVAGNRVSVTEIASKIGYENPNKFTSAFKETYGSSPTEFRKSVRLDRSGSVWSGEEI